MLLWPFRDPCVLRARKLHASIPCSSILSEDGRAGPKIQRIRESLRSQGNIRFSVAQSRWQWQVVAGGVRSRTAASEQRKSRKPDVPDWRLPRTPYGRCGSVAVSDLRTITVGLQPQSSHSLIMLNSDQLRWRWGCAQDVHSNLSIRPVWTWKSPPSNLRMQIAK